MLSLVNNGMYVMTDVATIDIPRSIEDLIPFASNLHTSLSVSRAFKSCCNGSSNENLSITTRREFKRDTLSAAQFDRLINDQQ